MLEGAAFTFDMDVRDEQKSKAQELESEWMMRSREASMIQCGTMKTKKSSARNATRIRWNGFSQAVEPTFQEKWFPRSPKDVRNVLACEDADVDTNE